MDKYVCFHFRPGMQFKPKVLRYQPQKRIKDNICTLVIDLSVDFQMDIFSHRPTEVHLLRIYTYNYDIFSEFWSRPMFWLSPKCSLWVFINSANVGEFFHSKPRSRRNTSSLVIPRLCLSRTHIRGMKHVVSLFTFLIPTLRSVPAECR